MDIGCGDGKITASIAKKVPQGFVIGIDSSEYMINLAKRKFPSKIYQNLSFIVKDVREMDFEEEFDIVFSNACLHWIIDHLPVLEKIEKSLKPSGKIFLQMGDKGNAAEVISVFETIIKDEKWFKFFNNFSFPYGFYDPEEYREWLKKVGFRIKRVELLPKDMIHKSEEQFTSWIRSTWLPYIQKVPEYLCEDFIREVVQVYIKRYPPDSKGFIHVQMVRLEVEAEKEI